MSVKHQTLHPNLDRSSIYSINRSGRLLNFWTLRVGPYSRWALIRGWARLLNFHYFQQVKYVYFVTKQ